MRRTPPAGDDRVNHSVLVARAREAPIRAGILEVFSIDGVRALSPAEMAFELQVSASSIAYHLRILELLRLVEISGEELIGGAYERRFCLVSQIRRLG